LRARREHPELFSGYTPLRAAGAAARHALAFDRGGAISVSTRLPMRLRRDGGWRDTTLRLGAPHRNAFTGEVHAADVLLAELFNALPVALLLRV
jgi:(1->4)-alpha-D-glucan 1-alpha-D-glucosylmutase